MSVSWRWWIFRPAAAAAAAALRARWAAARILRPPQECAFARSRIKVARIKADMRAHVLHIAGAAGCDDECASLTIAIHLARRPSVIVGVMASSPVRRRSASSHFAVSVSVSRSRRAIIWSLYFSFSKCVRIIIRDKWLRHGNREQCGDGGVVNVVRQNAGFYSAQLYAQ